MFAVEGGTRRRSRKGEGEGGQCRRRKAEEGKGGKEEKEDCEGEDGGGHVGGGGGEGVVTHALSLPPSAHTALHSQSRNRESACGAHVQWRSVHQCDEEGGEKRERA